MYVEWSVFVLVFHRNDSNMNGSVNPLTTKLFRVRKTVFKMITKRGYSVDDNDMNMTLDTFLREVTEMDPRKK